MKRWIVLLLVMAGCAQPKLPPVPNGKVDWPAGTVLVSRNKIESQNTSPGYWNHLYLYIGDGEGIESQSGQGVIKTSLKVYLARDYDWFPMFPVNELGARKAAAKSQTLVGLPYNATSSLMREDKNPEHGVNCVSVVRISYVDGLGHLLPKLKIPDDILEMPDVFTRQGGLKIYPTDNKPVVSFRKAA